MEKLLAMVAFVDGFRFGNGGFELFLFRLNDGLIDVGMAKGKAKHVVGLYELLFWEDDECIVGEFEANEGKPKFKAFMENIDLIDGVVKGILKDFK